MEDLKITSRDIIGDELKLLYRKGVYPYEYVDSHERFNETELPPKEPFYSQMTSMSWVALLKKTQINLYLLADIGMHLFME